MTQRLMKRLGTFLGVLVLAVAAASMAAQAQSGLSGFSLGQSTGGVLVQKDFNGITGSLGISFEDGCTASLSAGCTFSDITGSVLSGGSPVASYTLDFNSTPFLANFNGTGSWLFSAGDTSGYNLVTLAGGVNGTITWLTLNESLAGVDSMTGSATFTGTGLFAGLGSGTAAITLNLNGLSCANLSAGTACSLTGVSLDPPAPAGFATFGATFGSGGSTGGQTPEPGTLLLLGSGLTGIGFLRRKLWA
ncbi:MAG: PEP-CTERM sorting domain-containing protein [Candidatus Acidiferrales bacterium]